MNAIKQDPNIISDERCAEKLEASPAPRVTKEQIDSRIDTVTTSKLPWSETVTVCEIKLDNGFSVRGESACVNPENYDEEIGNKIAYDNAYRQLWAFFGFLLAETQHQS